VPPIYDLEVPDFALVKLGRRNISGAEARELLGNPHRESPNSRSPRKRERRFLRGETNGGRRLTLVVETNDDPTTWLVITGWDS
jgi:hypothetical protein